MTTSSIYGEIGPGERVALAKLAASTLEKTGRPFRVAIDISIWQFQVQAGKGGSNPALRTLYYRFVKLLALSIQPLFIFDGPNKPPFKRNVKTGGHTAFLPNMLAKEMLKLFGFPYITAPGEAEAECALLQREEIVDAVLSEDVDTLMFGCTMSMRNWSSEGVRGNKSPTHVDVYYSKATKAGKSGLDRDGMVLVALMSGGDYVPAGIPGCGIKAACEAARAGFGHDLCKLSGKDAVGLRQWRERLEYELQTNESGYFRTKHKAWKVPENFPDNECLGYYTHPVVSSAKKVSDLRSSIQWSKVMDIKGLRAFVTDAFEWHYLSGAYKFIRGIAPALLTQRLLQRADMGLTRSDVELQLAEERSLIDAFCARRVHPSSGGEPELRIIYTPAKIVCLDLQAEESDQYAGIVGSDSDHETLASEAEDMSRSKSPSKRRGPSKYDPTQPEKIWILEIFAKLGVPVAVETWEAEMRNPKKFASRKAREREAMARGGMPKGALDSFVRITKPRPRDNKGNKPVVAVAEKTDTDIEARYTDCSALPAVSATQEASVIADKRSNSKMREACMAGSTARNTHKKRRVPELQLSPSPKATPSRRTPTKSRVRPTPDTTPTRNDINPWTLARRPSDTFGVELDKNKRYSALGINCTPQSTPGRRHNNKIHISDDCHPSQQLNSPSRYRDPHSLKEPSEGGSTYGNFAQGIVIDLSSSPAACVSRPDTPTEARSRKHNHYKRPPSTELGLDTPSSEDTSSPNPNSNLPSNFRPSRSPDLQAHPLTLPSSPSSLPSPTTLLHPIVRETSLPQNTNLSQQNGRRTPPCAQGARGKIVLRSSLPGAWKEMERWEVGVVTPDRVLEGVEVLDLTRS